MEEFLNQIFAIANAVNTHADILKNLRLKVESLENRIKELEEKENKNE